jgi:16S rRNA (cytidine1402-2'-O)-methyltransferase
VVATPIGNLEDLSPRAATVLRSVSAVAAEDTRRTAKLTQRVGSSARLISVHAHAPPARLDAVVDLALAGGDVAVATDAGTPGISDPGPALVARARAAGVTVIAIPGPSAVAAALSIAGFPADRYAFLGFPPRRGRARTEWLASVAASAIPVVCFEAPGRVGLLVAELAARCEPSRRAVLARELTKAFEESRAGTLGDLAAELASAEVRGECTLVVEGGGRAPGAGTASPEPGLAVALARALRDAEVEGSRAARVIASLTGLSRNASYRIVLEGAE